MPELPDFHSHISRIPDLPTFCLIFPSELVDSDQNRDPFKSVARAIKVEDFDKVMTEGKTCYDALFRAHPVNDILDISLTTLWNGFGEHDYKTYGLPEPIGIRDAEKIKYEKIRELE